MRVRFPRKAGWQRAYPAPNGGRRGFWVGKHALEFILKFMAKISQTISQLQPVQNEIPHKFLRNVVFNIKIVFVSEIGLLSPTHPQGVTVQLQKSLENNFLFVNFQVCILLCNGHRYDNATGVFASC